MPKKIKRKIEFWWASIAGADPEPVEVTSLDGERVAYTCGCADPFYLDRKDCAAVLLMLDFVGGAGTVLGYKPVSEKRVLKTPYTGIERPLHPNKVVSRVDRVSNTEWHSPQHGWRGPR
jgi:hypothetical protein